MNSYFILCQARNWSLYTCNKRRIKIHLDLNGIDPIWQWFLERDIPQDHGCVQLVTWHVHNDGKHIIYTNEAEGYVYEEVWIRIFNNCENNNVYTGLYDKDGKRFCDVCLVIWHKDRPHVTNQGFAPGRCPDQAPPPP